LPFSSGPECIEYSGEWIPFSVKNLRDSTAIAVHRHYFGGAAPREKRGRDYDRSMAILAVRPTCFPVPPFSSAVQSHSRMEALTSFSPPSLTIAFASLSEVQNCHVLSLFQRCGDGLWLCCATIRPYLLARSCCSAKLPHRSGPHYTEYPDVVVNSGIGTHKSWCNRDAYPKVLQNKVYEYRVDIGLPVPSSIPGTECSSQDSRKVYRRD